MVEDMLDRELARIYLLRWKIDGLRMRVNVGSSQVIWFLEDRIVVIEYWFITHHFYTKGG